MSVRLTPRNALVAGVIAILALVPVYAEASGNAFIISLFTRIVILAIAAVSLNLIMPPISESAVMRWEFSPRKE